MTRRREKTSGLRHKKSKLVQATSALAEALELRTFLSAVPAPAHVVIVVEENYAYGDIIGNSAAPYINSLARQGANFTQSFAVTHPSQPNYLALFSASTQGVTADNGPLTFSGSDLRSALAGVGKTFSGYSEDLPSAGSQVLTSGAYARKHNP
jgi:phosphatidylinositol-3-phosphatase